ncbi:MAG TPA: hypothetical protein VHX17_08340 [Candidatus Cybelea sp.]|jgi:hypothetical protein|nr:hypothetical protein [Candidatus Cybelea sp.]
MQKDPAATARRLFDGARRRPAEPPVVATLLLFGQGALAYAVRRGIRILLLRQAELYRDASGALARLGIDVDAWPAPPAGLFVVEERALYLRSRSPMTVAHEFGHALDCALGGGVYRSGIDPQVRGLFANAGAFVTPYAATGVDEYFAESLRAYVEANDSASPWPRATRARLRHVDPGMHDYVEMLFEREFGERPNLGEVVSI